MSVVKTEEKKSKKFSIKEKKHLCSIGKRKTSVARIRLGLGKGNIIVNNKEFKTYFPTFYLQRFILQPLQLTKTENKFDISIKLTGGGIRSQAEAARHGIARVLEKYDNNLRIILKKAGFLRRDSRIKERKKYGLKRARRAPQWQKR